MGDPGGTESTKLDNTSWLLSILALTLASFLFTTYLVLEAAGARVEQQGAPWEFVPAIGRFALLAIPNVVVLLVIYSFADRILQRRGLDTSSRIAERVGGEVRSTSQVAEATLEQLANTATASLSQLSKVAAERLAVQQAPLEVVVNEMKLAQFKWEDDFLLKSNEATLIWRYGSRVLALWNDDFAAHLRRGGRLTFVLPNPANTEVVRLMSTDRPEELDLLDRIEETGVPPLRETGVVVSSCC